MKMVQLRRVPEELHRELKARAAREGMTLSDYATAQLERSVQKPSRRELLDRLAKLRPVEGGESSAESVRAERNAR